eukprot:1141947-Pelagomonas_calceolata.AAC.5
MSTFSPACSTTQVVLCDARRRIAVCPCALAGEFVNGSKLHDKLWSYLTGMTICEQERKQGWLAYQIRLGRAFQTTKRQAVPEIL